MCAYTFEITKWKVKIFTEPPKARYGDSQRLHRVCASCTTLCGWGPDYLYCKDGLEEENIHPFRFVSFNYTEARSGHTNLLNM